MNSHDWDSFGEEIKRTIQDAVEYGNYDRLNQNISKTVTRVTEQINKSFESTRQQTSKYTYGQSNCHKPTYQSQPVQERKYVTGLYKTTGLSKVLGLMLTVVGYSISGIFLFFTFLGVIASLAGGSTIAQLLPAVITLLLIVSGFAFMGYKGNEIESRGKRFEQYVKEIGNAEVCNISDLAVRVNKSKGFVVKDLEKMINKGWFRQGHLDRQKTCLIVTNQMYQQYKQIEQQRDLQQKEERDTAKKQAESRKGLTPEVQKIIDQGDAYVKKIRECNDAIPGEEVSEKIYRIELVVDKIFDRVEQNPNSVSDIRKLMDYYLPTTVKLLEAYAQMDSQPVGGENIQTAKKEIEATLDTLNVAFEKLLDSLFQDAAWDVSSDISVLNTMLAQEGLKEDGLNKNGGK